MVNTTVLPTSADALSTVLVTPRSALTSGSNVSTTSSNASQLPLPIVHRRVTDVPGVSDSVAFGSCRSENVPAGVPETTLHVPVVPAALLPSNVNTGSPAFVWSAPALATGASTTVMVTTAVGSDSPQTKLPSALTVNRR